MATVSSISINKLYLAWLGIDHWVLYRVQRSFVMFGIEFFIDYETVKNVFRININDLNWYLPTITCIHCTLLNQFAGHSFLCKRVETIKYELISVSKTWQEEEAINDLTLNVASHFIHPRSFSFLMNDLMLKNFIVRVKNPWNDSKLCRVLMHKLRLQSAELNLNSEVYSTSRDSAPKMAKS